MAGPLTQAPPMAPTGTDSPQVSGSSSNHHMPTTSSLLFGFLLSFLVLFMVFMGCGLTSRYMVDRRRQRALILTESDLYGGTGGVPTPTMWDVWTVPGEENWKDITPLAVQIRKDIPSHVLTRAAQRHQPTPTEEIVNLYHQIKERAAHLLTNPWRRSHIDASSRSSRPRTTDGKVDIQIAVLVAMPHPFMRKSVETIDETGCESVESDSAEVKAMNTLKIPDVAMGIVTVPWDKQKTSFG